MSKTLIFHNFTFTFEAELNKTTRRKIVEVILLNFRSNLGYKDKLEVI